MKSIILDKGGRQCALIHSRKVATHLSINWIRVERKMARAITARHGTTITRHFLIIKLYATEMET